MSDGRKTEGIAESGALGRGRKPAVPKPILITIAVFIIAIIAVYFTFPSGARKENTSLPKFKSSNFTKVIHAPSVRQLSIWKDNQGRDCLAALEAPRNSNPTVSIYTNAFEVASRFELTSGPEPSFFFAAYKLPDDILPNIYLESFYGVGLTFIQAYKSSGDLIYSIHSFMRPLLISDSPSKPNTPVIIAIYGGNTPAIFEFFNISDFSPRQHDNLHIAYHLQKHGPIVGATETDWNFDGIKDSLYWGKSGAGDDILLPVVSGNVGPPISLGDAPPGKDGNTVMSFAAARYIENGTSNVVAAFNQPLWRKRSYSQFAEFIYKYYAPPIFKGNKIYWTNLQTGTDITKEYRRPHINFFTNTILLEDVTGDGKPEVIAVVEWTRLVIYDLDGNELYNKLLFKHSNRFWGISNLLSGDFDGDGKVDIVFAYRNGIFIPDLSALRN